MVLVLRKICVVTGSRAEYGLLFQLMKAIEQCCEFQLQLVVTGMHLSPEFGNTYTVIEKDGFYIDEKVEMLLSSDTAVGIAQSMGLGLIGFSGVLARLKPDLMVVLGDRYEILAAVQAALVARVPVAHIAGGDTTEGAIDEAIRHSITKMSHLHFVTNQDAWHRVVQMGENRQYVFNVGSPGIDMIKSLPLLSRRELEERIQFSFLEKNILVTFHPVTLDSRPSTLQFSELLTALELLGRDTGILFTKPNADTEGRSLINMLNEYVAKHPNTKAVTSLGQLGYYSAIAQVDVVVGNSSSGLYEVPSFDKPTVNIGTRQKGRLQASSIINCEAVSEEIYVAIQKAYSLNCKGTQNPYGQGNAVEQILQVLLNQKDYSSLLQKQFCEVSC